MGQHMVRKPNRRTWIIVGTAVGLFALAILVTFPLWFPRFARTFIPDRYMVAYAPEFIREMVFDNSRFEEEPVAADVNESEIEELLAGLETGVPPATPTITQVPTSTPVLGTPETAAAAPTEVPTSTARTVEVEILDGQFLYGFEHEYQGWNRCGPATLSTAMSYFGSEQTQVDVAAQIKPHDDDRNVRPDEMVAYANGAGYGALYRVNGRIETLEALLSAGFPVIVERGFDELPEEDWMGHYMLLIGFSQPAQEFYALDSYWGPDQTWTYNRLDQLWRHFSRTYIVLYEPSRLDEVATIIGDEMDDAVMYQNALQRARDDLEVYDDSFAWYNLGAALTDLGNYENAAVAFDAARERVLPWRMYWYRFELYEAYHATGRYNDLLTLTRFTTDVTNYPESEEGHYWMGQALLAVGEERSARAAFNRSLEINVGYTPARLALNQLEGS